MPGSVRLRDCEILKEITSKHAEEKRLYGGISTSPAVTLLPWGLLRRKRVSTGLHQNWSFVHINIFRLLNLM